MKKVAKNALPPPKIYRGSLTAWDNVSRKRVYFGKQDDPTSRRKYAEWVESLAQSPPKSLPPDSPAGGVLTDTVTLNLSRLVQQKTACPAVADGGVAV